MKLPRTTVETAGAAGQCRKAPGDKLEPGDLLKTYGKWQL